MIYSKQKLTELVTFQDGYMLLDDQHLQVAFEELNKLHPHDYNIDPITHFALRHAAETLQTGGFKSEALILALSQEALYVNKHKPDPSTQPSDGDFTDYNAEVSFCAELFMVAHEMAHLLLKTNEPLRAHAFQGAEIACKSIIDISKDRAQTAAKDVPKFVKMNVNYDPGRYIDMLAQIPATNDQLIEEISCDLLAARAMEHILPQDNSFQTHLVPFAILSSLEFLALLRVIESFVERLWTGVLPAGADTNFHTTFFRQVAMHLYYQGRNMVVKGGTTNLSSAYDLGTRRFQSLRPFLFALCDFHTYLDSSEGLLELGGISKALGSELSVDQLIDMRLRWPSQVT